MARVPPRRGAVVGATSALAYGALALGGVSMVGVMVFFDPVFTAGRIFGTLALGMVTTIVSHRTG